MAFIPVENVARVDIRYLQLGEETENVIHVRKVGGWTDVDMETLFDTIEEWVRSTWMPLLPNSTSCQALICTDLTTAESNRNERTLIPPPAGGSGAGLPSAMTFAVHKNAIGRGRTKQGRLYVPGIPGNAYSGNNLNQATATEYVQALDTLRNLIAGLTTPVAEYGIVSYQENGVTRTEGEFALITTHSYRDLALDVQRRRAGGRGQ